LFLITLYCCLLFLLVIANEKLQIFKMKKNANFFDQKYTVHFFGYLLLYPPLLGKALWELDEDQTCVHRRTVNVVERNSLDWYKIARTLFVNYTKGRQYVAIRSEFAYYVLRNKIVPYQRNVPQFNFWSVPYLWLKIRAKRTILHVPYHVFKAKTFVPCTCTSLTVMFQRK